MRDYEELVRRLRSHMTERLPEAWEEVMLQFPNNQAAGWAKKLQEPPKEEK